MVFDRLQKPSIVDNVTDISKENSIKFFRRIMRSFGTIKNKNISSLYNRGPSLRRGGTVQHLRFMLLWDSVQRRFGTWVNT